jgi:carboxylesterase type B
VSVATLLAMPRAKGLFSRAIVQSGTAQNVTSACRP